jgi:hypothetical protein
MTTEELAREFPLILDKMPDIIYGSLFAGANEFESDMSNRVFNNGQDINGSQIGEYSKSYAEYRRSKGRQTATVDLQLFGNLRKSIITTRIKGGWSVKFANAKQAQIGRKNEVRFKGKENTIFEVSAKEKEDMIKVTQLEFDARVRDAFKQLA